MTLRSPGARVNVHDLVSSLTQACRAAGFDLAASCRCGDYNALVDEPLRLPDLGSPEHLAVVVGNTRAVWPHFKAALRDDPLATEPDPFDRWTEATLGAVVETVRQAFGVTVAIRYAHEPPPRRIAMQRLADVAGLAHLGPAHLSVHPEYGPWIALRAVVVFRAAFEGPSASTPAPQPCTSCLAKPCTTALQNAVDRGAHASWRDWLELRRACPVGVAWRYGDEQTRYHYVKDPEILR